MPKQEESSGILEFFVHDCIHYQDLNLLHIQLLKQFHQMRKMMKNIINNKKIKIPFWN